jgi:hypothetical protein
MVAGKLGTFQLALVRPLESADAAQPEEKRKTKPVWAWDVSPAIRDIPPPPPEPYACDPKSSYTGSTLECSIRVPPNLPYQSAPLASTVIAPSNGERRPYGAEGGRRD